MRPPRERIEGTAHSRCLRPSGYLSGARGALQIPAGILDDVSSYPWPHSRAVRIGLVLFVIGLGFIAADVLPFFADDHNTSLWLNLACLLAPAGFAVAVWAGLRNGREEQRAALRELGG